MSEEQNRLPLPALLALAMTGFIAIMSETLPAGLLPQIAAGLHVSQSLAGQLTTLFAAGTLVAAIPLTSLTQGWRRKPTLLAAIGGILVFNVITAVSDNYTLILLARLLAGVASGLAWVVIGGFARRMVTARPKGKALAIAMVGTPLALSLGVPAGAFLGTTIGWRAAFFGLSGATVFLVAWVMWAVPDFAGRPPERRRSIRQVFLTPGVRPILATIFTWMAAHNMLYTYIAPFAAWAGYPGDIDVPLLSFGLAALVGIAITAARVDHQLRGLALASVGAFLAATLVFGLSNTGASAGVFVAGIVVWGLSFGGAATQLQTACADAAGDGADLATAMIATVWNTAIAAGGVFGGYLLHVGGAGSLPWAMLPLIVASISIVYAAKKHAFKPGPRALGPSAAAVGNRRESVAC